MIWQERRRRYLAEKRAAARHERLEKTAAEMLAKSITTRIRAAAKASWNRRKREGI
jgi:hypothetical protein